MAIESLVLGREKRSTAGNRMRALLDKAHALETEEGFEEPEDDDDFQGFEEQDVFEEDFESTDEEEGAMGEQGVDEGAERALRKEERAEKRAQRTSVNPTRPTNYVSTGILKQQGYNLNSPEFSYLKKFGRKRERRESGLRREVKIGVDSDTTVVAETGKEARIDVVRQPETSTAVPAISEGATDSRPAEPSGPPKKKRRVSFYPGDVEGGNSENAVAGPSSTSPAGRRSDMENEEQADATSVVQTTSGSADLRGASPSPRSEDGVLATNDDEQLAEDSESDPDLPERDRRLPGGRIPMWAHREGDLGRKSSMRASTRANKEEVDQRVQEEKRKSSTYISRYTPRNTSTLTQADYIALALETEEQNRESLKDWLEKEEARKQLSRLERKIVAGPRISWISRRVEGGVVGGLVELESEESTRVEKGKAKEDGSLGTTSTDPPAPTTTATSAYTRNYVILSQISGSQKGELRTLFGDQGDWTNMPHIPTRSRPQTRRPVICPLTGLIARYRHPGTGIPFATASCYKIIDEIVKHRYVWSSQRHAYLSDAEDTAGAAGMQEDGVESWEEACSGWWKGGEEEVAELLEMPERGGDIEME